MVKRMRHYGKSASSREEWSEVIKSLTPFNASGMSGRATYSADATGDLPEPYRSQFRNGRPDYAVFSYATPIAWHDAADGKWHVPDVNYSLTTTGHQHTARMAVDTWGGERWAHDYVTGPHVNLREGRGSSPYGERTGGF